MNSLESDKDTGPTRGRHGLIRAESLQCLESRVASAWMP